MKMFVQHLQAVPLPPSQRSELPIAAEIDALVLDCLEKDPARRPQSIHELQRRLDRVSVPRAWDNGAARDWWERHLVELAAPVSPDPAQLKTTRLAA